MDEQIKIIVYDVKDPKILKEINDYLTRKSTEYGFGEEGEELCFIDQEGEIFAITDDKGKVELRSDDPEIRSNLEKLTGARV